MCSDRSRTGIQIRGLSKRYSIYDRPSQKLMELVGLSRFASIRGHWALEDLDLDIPAATTLGILGQNGSGKSTLLQIIADILEPTRGVCRVQGSVAALLELGAGFNPEFTGRENVFLNASIRGFSRRRIEERMDEILAFAEIGEFIDQPVKTYSSGMFLRLAFSAAIHVDPDILLVDEALAVGDLIFQHRCINRIRRLRKEGRTIVLVTHDLHAITKFCDRAVLLDAGRKIAEGRPEEVVTRYRELIFKRQEREEAGTRRQVSVEEDKSLDLVTTIPHVHNRFGEKGAEVIGILVHSFEGNVMHEVRAGDEVNLLISARTHRALEHPIVGFSIKDSHGVEISSSNTSYEGIVLPASREGDALTVAFRIEIPQVRPGSYSISPAVSDGDIWDHVIHDWIDNAYILDVVDTHLVYGMMRWSVEPSFRVHRSESTTSA